MIKADPGMYCRDGLKTVIAFPGCDLSQGRAHLFRSTTGDDFFITGLSGSVIRFYCPVFAQDTGEFSLFEVERLIFGQRCRYPLRSGMIGFDLTNSQVLCVWFQE